MAMQIMFSQLIYPLKFSEALQLSFTTQGLDQDHKLNSILSGINFQMRFMYRLWI